nr:unnamed protein product [Callosobruchus chinensis]
MPESTKYIEMSSKQALGI